MDESLRWRTPNLCHPLLVRHAVGADNRLDDWPRGYRYALCSGVLNALPFKFEYAAGLWLAAFPGFQQNIGRYPSIYLRLRRAFLTTYLEYFDTA